MEDEREPLAAQQERYREQTLLSSSMGSRMSPSNMDGKEENTIGEICCNYLPCFLSSSPFHLLDSRSANSLDMSGGRFECNICLDDMREPVVTQCGHLFCWSCLYRWLNMNHQTCPLCKAGVTKENVIPLFIRGSSKDPRDRVLNGFCLSCFLLTKCIISEVFTLVPFDPLRSLCRH